MGADCTSAVGVCTAGTVASGDLAGRTHYTAETLGEGMKPDLVIYTGELVITAETGTVTLDDLGFLDSSTGNYLEYQRIVAGTGAYEGASGALTSQGAATSTGFSGTLTGAICTRR